jgi:hypothetical protein
LWNSSPITARTPVSTRWSLETDATETSLAENTIRVAMHPADQFIAFPDLVVQTGLGIDDVAARFGVSPLFVWQRLKLANVAPRLINAYRAAEIRLDQLEALAITDDQQAQEKVWDSLRHDWERSPITSVLYSPKNTSALPIAARASSALMLMSPLGALSNVICSTKKTKDI